MNEVSISSARASVMVYDDVNKKWIPSGSSSGLSKVQLYHHQLNNTFRVVGRKLQDHEIVINCAILKGLKYNQATSNFHQWRDNKHVYGLNFSSKDDADAFAKAMLQALDVLSNGTNISRILAQAVVPNAPPTYQQQPPSQQQQQQPQQLGTTQYEEDMGYSQNQSMMGALGTVGNIGNTKSTSRVSLPLSHPMGSPLPSSMSPTLMTSTTTVIQVGGGQDPRSSLIENVTRTMTREDVAIIQERRMSQQNQAMSSPSAVSPGCPVPSQQPSGHHRTSSAPPAPQPPVMPGMINPVSTQMTGGGPPVPPPQPPVAPPPPCPPPCPPCPPAMINYQLPAGNNAPVASSMTNQYAPAQPINPPQSQSIYGTNQGNQYGAGQNNQYNSSHGSQYSSSGQTNLYGTTGQNNHYSSNASIQSSIYSGSQGSQYGGSQGTQYGSSNSINQYETCQAQAPLGNAQTQSQYGTNIAQNQFNSAQIGNNSSNPYGTPPNLVNQYGGHSVNSNTYAPVGSAGPLPPPMGPSGAPAAPPPPPPPPAPNANINNSEPVPDTNSLAAALQAARLKKKQLSQPIENSGSSTSSSGSTAGGGGGNYGTLGRGGGGGMASMMDEMAKTLARRRAAVEKKQPEQPPEPESSPGKGTWDKNNSSNNKFPNGAESPKSARKRFGSASEDTLLKVNGINDGAPLSAQEMEAFKAEIIKDVRREFQKMKQEIVEALRSELSRR